MKRRTIWLIGGLAIIGVAAAVFFVRIARENFPNGPVVFGATFSKKYAQSLGLDWRAAYTAVLDELGVRLLRIPAYWDEIEPETGRFVFDDLDWQLREAEARDAKVLLAVGQKLPRWPECHFPSWIKNATVERRQLRTLAMLQRVVSRYRGSKAVWAWQVENEPLFDFGECPPPDVEFLKKEIELVRSLDSTRPIVVTDSGELSTWLPAAELGDILGISMYRVVWTKFLGYFYYPITPGFYRFRAEAIRSLTPRVIITELQVEPWVARAIPETPLSEQYKSMDAERVRSNVEFARRAGLSEVYVWGVEWWYWLRGQGNDEIWEYGKSIF